MSNDMIQKATAQPAAKADAKTSMQAYIKQMQGEIKKALPAVMTPERFTRIVLSAFPLILNWDRLPHNHFLLP